MNIRRADIRDSDKVRDLYLAAFSEAELVGDLAVNLFGEETAPETFALVAEADGELVGHISFSPVACTGAETSFGYILSPLAVHPDFQKRGIGTQLVESGMQHLSLLDVGIVFVYGDPKYYGRFGFDADAAAKFTPPYELEFSFGWHAKRLIESDGFPVSGELTCVHSLMDPKLW